MGDSIIMMTESRKQGGEPNAQGFNSFGQKRENEDLC